MGPLLNHDTVTKGPVQFLILFYGDGGSNVTTLFGFIMAAVKVAATSLCLRHQGGARG